MKYIYRILTTHFPFMSRHGLRSKNYDYECPINTQTKISKSEQSMGHNQSNSPHSVFTISSQKCKPNSIVKTPFIFPLHSSQNSISINFRCSIPQQKIKIHSTSENVIKYSKGINIWLDRNFGTFDGVIIRFTVNPSAASASAIDSPLLSCRHHGCTYVPRLFSFLWAAFRNVAFYYGLVELVRLFCSF